MNVLLRCHHIEALAQVQNFLGCLLNVGSDELQNTAYMSVYVIDVVTNATLNEKEFTVPMELHHGQVLYTIVENYVMAVQSLGNHGLIVSKVTRKHGDK
jgi:hypothetical protein